MALNFMFPLFASSFFIFPVLALLKFFKSKSRELPLLPGTLGWPTWSIGENSQLYSQNQTVFFASKLKGYVSIFFSQGLYKLVLRASMLKSIKSIVSNIKSIAKDSLPSMKGRLIATSHEMKAPGLVDFPKSMKKVGKLELVEAIPFALTLLLLLSAKAAGKTLEYGFGNAPPSWSTHPPPVNDPTRGCNTENYCRHFTLTAGNPKNSIGTQVEAFAMVDVGAPLNSTAPGLEAIIDGIATWHVNNTKSGRLSVSVNATADADRALVLQLKRAVRRGIAKKELVVQYRSGSMSSDEMATLCPAAGSITITVGAAANQVDLKFMTYVESFGQDDVIWIMEHAKAILAGGP